MDSDNEYLTPDELIAELKFYDAIKKFNGLIVSESTLGQSFIGLYRSQKWTDVTLTVRSTTFKAHRVILYSRCQYFKEIFEANNKQIEIEMDNSLNPDAFGLVLAYIYGGEIFVEDNNIDDIEDIAIKLNLNLLLDRLENFKGVELTQQNILEMICFYHERRNQAAFNKCLLYLDHVFTTGNFTENPMLISMPFEILKQILQRPTLDARENDLVLVIDAWHEKTLRRGVHEDILNHQAKELAKLLKLHLIDPELMFKIVQPKGWIATNLLWDALKEHMEYQNDPFRDHSDPRFQKRTPGPKKQRLPKFTVAILGLEDAGKTTVKMYMKKTMKVQGYDYPGGDMQMEEVIIEQNNRQMHVRDFRGTEDGRKRWKCDANKDIDGLIWVIDANKLDPLNIDALNDIIEFVDKPDLPVLILANCKDRSDANAGEITSVHDLLRITPSMYYSEMPRVILKHWHIQTIVATKGVGVLEGIDYHKRKYYWVPVHRTDVSKLGVEWLLNTMVEVCGSKPERRRQRRHAKK